MTVHPICVLPQDQEVLRAKAKKVRSIDPSIRRLVDDMMESMHAAEGVGIAASQIGVSLRVIVIGIPDEEPFALINPQIVKISGERRILEGCLSVPGYRGEITRALKVVAKGLNLDGKEMRLHAEDDLLAQALQHEIDHVNGTIYIDHLQSPDDLFRLEDLERAEHEHDDDHDTHAPSDPADADGPAPTGSAPAMPPSAGTASVGAAG